jgi:hypothetical protein
MTDGIAGLDDALAELDAWGRARDWVGPDPYEGLNATRMPPLKRPLARRLLIQAVRRSPLDLRPALGIEPGENAAALAHVLAGYVRLDGPALPSGGSRRAAIDTLTERLAGLAIPGLGHPCWGYHFPFQSRFFFYDERTPNTIATSFAALALLDAHQALGTPGALELATGGAEVLAERMRTAEGHFGYVPGDRTLIHNANLLAAAVLAGVGAELDRPELLEAARAGLARSLAGQRGDGSWPYAEGARGDWVDGYHTGYALDAVLRCATALADDEALAAYGRGLDFYDRTLVGPDGAPYAFAGRPLPTDGIAVAQAIKTFALAAGADGGRLARARGVFEFARGRMRRGDGAFVFQRHRLFTNRVPHVRWVQAPMLESLAILKRAQAGAGR